MDNGWIKLHRKFKDWEWSQDPNTSHLFVRLLLMANHKKRSWKGIDILPGQIVTGRKKLSSDTGLSEQSVRTSLNKLKSTNEVTIESTKQYSIIEIINWKNYQQVTNNLTNEQPTTNQQLTTNKNVKKEKNVKNNPLTPKGDGTFEMFWKEYPKKVGKGAAEKLWKKIGQPASTLVEIISALEWQRESEQWTKDNGSYIPNPSTYLSQRRWEDERSNKSGIGIFNMKQFG